MGESLYIVEVIGDIFKPEDWYDGDTKDLYYAHCIASDFGMYGGIAKQFVDKMDMKRKLIDYRNKLEMHDLVPEDKGYGLIITIPKLVGRVVLIDNVFNLITKRYTNVLPKKYDFESSIYYMVDILVEKKIKNLAIPDMIGCGIDGLSRSWVLKVLEKALGDLDITLYVVKLQN